jgi:hypothetical protein
LLTLYTTPVMYLYLDRFRLRMRGLWRRTRLGKVEETIGDKEGFEVLT